MTLLGTHEFRVHVVIYPEDDAWIAQGVEFDITARGNSPIEASERFHDKFGAELIMSIELGDEEPLSSVGSAPKEFWTMYEGAKMRVLVDEAPLRLTSGPAPHVRPEIRITNQRRAA
jgi:hypothetical protein